MNPRPDTTTTGQPRIREFELVALMASVMALQALSIDTMLPALPEIGADLGAPAGNSRQLVVSLYIACNGFGCLFPGALADRFGRKPVIMAALGFYFALSVACALATGFTQMLVLRGLQGMLASSLSVIPAAIIRDRYEGDRMARLMSLISAVFITVPILAPSLGQLILLVAHWRWIFVVLAVASLGIGIWFWRRMPETLHPEFRQPIVLRPLVGHMWKAVTTRASFGYVLSTALVMSGIFGYLNSAQQLIGEHFGAGSYFALIFGICAASMILSNIANARIVERFGARRVSHTGLLVFIAVSAAQVWFAFGEWQSLVWFMPLIAMNMALLGFLGANFSSISMQPFAEAAGAASSAQNFIRLLGGALLGMLIGQAYDGSSRSIALALLASGIGALLLILFSEKGRLFRRLNPPRRLH
jgi:DHA1 family bicyclomycin/chloramphenicol resistance-like MFS transporter